MWSDARTVIGLTGTDYGALRETYWEEHDIRLSEHDYSGGLKMKGGLSGKFMHRRNRDEADEPPVLLT